MTHQQPGPVPCFSTASAVWRFAIPPAVALLVSCLSPTDEPQLTAQASSKNFDDASNEIIALLGLAQVDEGMLHPGPSFDIRSHADRLVAAHPQATLRYIFSGGELSLSSAQDESWRTSVALAGVERGLSHLESVPLLVERSANNHIILERDHGVIEWYLYGPLGLEQGFTLTERPLKTDDGSLVITLEVAGGLTLELSQDDETLRFNDDQGQTLLRYARLMAVDSAGSELPARLDVEGQQIHLIVDDREASYPIVIDPLFFEDKVTHSNDALDHFGWSIATNGNVLLCGAPDDERNTDSGATYWFRRQSGSWSYATEDTVWHSAMEGGSSFGYSVAIDGDYSVVGAPDSRLGEPHQIGLVFAYYDDGNGIAHDERVQPNGLDGGDDFGASVAMDYPLLVVGAPGDDDLGYNSGAVYIFRHTGSIWTFVDKLTASDGGEYDEFGSAVAISEERIVVGAPGYDDALANMGTIYSFTRGDLTWEEDASRPVLTLIDENTSFGKVLVLDGNRLLAGVPNADDGYYLDTGLAALYSQDVAGTWSLLHEFTPETIEASSRFGRCVDLEGDVVIIGEPGLTYLGLESGVVHVYVDDDIQGWVEAEIIAPSDAHDYQMFGHAVDLHGGLLVVGAYGDDELGNQAGAFYTYNLSLTNGSPCPGFFECESGHCVDSVCCESSCGGGALDCQACSEAGGGVTDGVCGPLTAAAAAGVICRDVAGYCDVAETCDPSSTSCPTNTFLDAGTNCRDVAGDCDHAEVCSGSSATCPRDAFLNVGIECRAAAGDCDITEVCSGASAHCPDNLFAGNETECRASTGQCDGAESCSGLSAACPRDDLLSMNGESCDDGVDWTFDDVCDNGTCGGAELGRCEGPIIIDSLPYTEISTTEGRPSHISSYGESCTVTGGTASDVIYQLNVTAGVTYRLNLSPDESFSALLLLTEGCTESVSCLATADEDSMEYTAEVDGSVTLVVEGEGDAEGGYALSVETVEATDGDADADVDGDSDGDGGGDGDGDGDADGGESASSCSCMIASPTERTSALRQLLIVLGL